MNERRLAAVIGAAATLVLTIAVLLAAGTVCAKEPAPMARPASWAQPVEMEGVPNLYKVSDDLYRSAQPSAEGMANLEQMGIRTVVNLRLLNSDRGEIEGTNLECVRIRMEAWRAEENEVERLLEIVSDPDRVPVLVHCNLGADRTGTMCAAYRVAVQGWSKKEAIAEMTQGGFGFNAVWSDLPLWIWTADFDEMKTPADADQVAWAADLGNCRLAGVASRWAAHYRGSKGRLPGCVLPAIAASRSGSWLVV